jgi:hypothetical protein
MSISTNKPLGIPAGGTTGQVLAKASDNNYDFTWVPGGGSPVTSVFGRNLVVVAVSGDYNTDLITEGSTNLFFTNTRAQAALTATTPLVFTSGNLSINQSSAMMNGYISATNFTTFNNKGAGNITSVDVSVPSFLAVSNNPITTSGTITIAANSGQTANYVLATPNGSPDALSLRALVAADIPNLSAAKITSGVLAMSNGGAPQPLFYGLGQLGDVTISSGTTTLTDDYYVNNLTISGSGSIATAGYRIFVAGTLDLTNAPLAAIFRNGSPGNAGSGASGGAIVASFASNTVGSSNASVIGGNSGTGAGTAGGASSFGATNLGGQGGAGGSGGAPALAAGAAGGATTTNSNVVPFHRFDFNVLRGAGIMIGGGSGASGGGANGDGTNNGGGAGSGATGGCVIYIACNILKRDTTTAVGAIRAAGSTGGAGANSSGGNSGGGGGAGGGGGGYVFIAYAQLQGNAATNLINVSGGTGGAGGNGTGTGRGGRGGQGGAGGRVTLINMSTGVITETQSTTTLPSAATTPTTTAGTAGTTGTVTSVTL